MSPPDQIQNVCANIRYLRAKHELSRTAMARRIHVALKTLDSIESGVMPDKCGVMLLFHVYREFGILPGHLVTAPLEDTKNR